MRFVIESPSVARIEGATQDDMKKLSEQLTYTNTAQQHLVKRHYANKWLRNKDEEAWKSKLEELKLTVKNTLVFGDHIRPGSIPYLKDLTFDVVNKVSYISPKPVAWYHILALTLYPYQETSWQELLKIRHGNVELCTGAGKSIILLKLCRETGFRTAIIAPSRSIFNELVEKFEYHLGKTYIGKFGDGKKVLGKRFTICLGDSLANVKPGTEAWDFFSKLDMLCVDESHTWGAKTLEDLCHGIFADIPYRLFFSGTQTRGDGAEKLLQSIIGKTVHTLTTKQAVEGEYNSPHEFRIVKLESSNPNYTTPDILDMKRVHFLKNKNIAAFVAKLANVEARMFGRQTLVLVEELEQISMLTKLLEVPYVVAHSEVRPKRLQELGFEKVDPAESVEKFNKNEAKVLIGTSCISTGTNIYPTHNTVNWVGGSSEIKTKQGAVGRSVRLSSQNPWKDKCVVKEKSIIWDFDVYDVYLMGKLLEDRLSCYMDSGSVIKYVNLLKR